MSGNNCVSSAACAALVLPLPATSDIYKKKSISGVAAYAALRLQHNRRGGLGKHWVCNSGGVMRAGLRATSVL